MANNNYRLVIETCKFFCFQSSRKNVNKVFCPQIIREKRASLSHRCIIDINSSIGLFFLGIECRNVGPVVFWCCVCVCVFNDHNDKQ